MFFWYVMNIIGKTDNQINADGAHLLYDSLQYNTTLTSLTTGCKLKKYLKSVTMTMTW